MRTPLWRNAAPLNSSYGYLQVFTGRSLDQVGAECVFVDPAIAIDGGYAQVVPASGRGAVLIVLPESEGLEGWRMLFNDPTPRSVTFEGFYSMEVYTEAWAAHEWKGAAMSWNPPTSATIAAGGSKRLSFRLTSAPSVREVPTALLRAGRPVVVAAVPGYIISPEMQNVTVVVSRTSEHTVESASVDPRGSLVLCSHTLPAPLGTTHCHSSENSVHVDNGTTSLGIAAVLSGHATVTLVWSDKSRLSIQYFVHPASSEHIRHYSRTLGQNNWSYHLPL